MSVLTREDRQGRALQGAGAPRDLPSQKPASEHLAARRARRRSVRPRGSGNASTSRSVARKRAPNAGDDGGRHRRSRGSRSRTRGRRARTACRGSSANDPALLRGKQQVTRRPRPAAARRAGAGFRAPRRAGRSADPCPSSCSPSPQRHAFASGARASGYRWHDTGYLLVLSALPGNVERAEPFDSIEADIADLLGGEPAREP